VVERTARLRTQPALQRSVSEIDLVMVAVCVHWLDPRSQDQSGGRESGPKSVESRLGTSTGTKAPPRFPAPLIKPDVLISSSRLSD
jgi:hypothetical protein